MGLVICFSVSSLPCINENGLAMICNFVISDLKPGNFFFFFVFLIGSRFRAFRLGPKGRLLDGARGARGARLGRVQALEKKPG